jgi:hypothetical protein
MSIAKAPRRRLASLPALAVLCGVLVVSACRPPRTASAAVSLTPPELFGWVLRLEGTDTVPAANARVWTEPASDAVTTKSDGYWAISAGLVPGSYRVMAEYEGIGGRSQRLTASLGRTDTVMVLIGAADTPWPPALAFVNKIPKATRGPAVIR